MARLISNLIIATYMIAALLACERKPQPGYLVVNASSDGAYEIYRIANEAPLQFISEQTGDFNKPVALTPGSYLVLADCSSETVIVYPGETETLAAHRLEFVPPHNLGENDSFAIQCNRSDKTRSRQHLTNRFALNVIHGKRDLLVGMVPMHIDFTTLAPSGTPITQSFKLSALQVANFEGNDQETSYFVSPVDELISLTKYQPFGHWALLLPGQYFIEVNGTRMQISLAEGEERIVKPALLKVSTSSEVDLEQPIRVRGSPWLVEINNGHWLNFNEIYPVLPGTAEIKIGSSSRSIEIQLEEGGNFELQARSVLVDMGCDTHDVACLGDKDVSLSLEGDTYPFVESLSDMPILFIDEGLPVFVGIAGSRDILYQLPGNVRDKVLNIGFVKLIPQPQHRPGQVTDLVRVDAVMTTTKGHTLDINLERPTLMPLVAGHYRLAHYLSLSATEGARSNHMRPFTIEAGKTIDIEIPVYFNEKKFSAYRKKLEETEQATAPEPAQKAQAL